MSGASRAVAAAAGIALIVLAAAGLARQAALASDDVVWPSSSWWARLTCDPSWGTTGVAAAVAAALAVALLVMAARQLAAGTSSQGSIEFSDEPGSATLSVAGLERALQRRLEAVLPGCRVTQVELRRGVEGWLVRVTAALPGVDMVGQRERAATVLRDDLRRIGGLELVRLDLVATSLVAVDKARR